MHTIEEMSRSMELLEQAQKIARIGAWEWFEGEEKALWTDEMFALLEMEKTPDNRVFMETFVQHIHPDEKMNMDIIRNRFLNADSLQLHFRWITSKGNQLYVQCLCQSFFDENGKLIKVRGTCQDISAFRNMEQTLERRSAALTRAEEMAHIGSFHINLQKNESFYSDNMFRLFGYEPGTVPAEEDNFCSLIYSEDKKFVTEKYEEVKNSSTDYNFSFRIVRKDGSLRFLQASGRSYQNQSGEKILEGAIRDITEWHLMEDELERQNYMLQQAEETASFGSWKYNFSTQHIHYSDNLYKMFGYTPREFVNKLENIYEKVHPEDLPMVLDTYRQTIKDRQPRNINFRIKVGDAIRYYASHGRITSNRHGEKIIIGTVQDITEQHELHQKLQSQNDFIQKLIDSSVNCILVIDRNKRYKLWNRQCEILYGLKKEDVIGRTTGEVFGNYDMSLWEQAIERAFLGEKVKIDEMKSRVTGLFYEMHAIPLPDANGNTEQVFVLMHDVTRFKKLNEALKEQKEFAEAVIDHNQACVFVFDTEQKYIKWNRKCEELYGIRKEDVIGKTLTEVFPNADMSVPIARLKKAMEGHTCYYPAEHSRVLNKYYDSYVIPMKNAGGEVTQILCLLNDITEIISISNRIKEANRLLEQKKAELTERTNFLETLLNASTDFICVYDKELRIMEINKTALDKYGLKKEETIGKLVTETFKDIEETVHLKNMKNALLGEASAAYEFSNATGDRTFFGSQVPLYDHNNEVFAALTVSHDITSLKRTMLQLEELNHQFAAKNNELNRINSELASFSYVASHDLQEPLRKIQAFISLIFARDGSVLSESTQDYFGRIRTSANRMQQMIDGLLSFSRTNTTEKKFEEKPLHEEIDKVLHHLHEDISNTKALVENTVRHTAAIIPHQFEQLLEHVISNALKFQPEHQQPHIRISSQIVSGKDIEGEVAQRNRNYCKIAIADNGVGFEMEDVEKIFQMFQRLHGKSEYPGTGIGLAICRRIAQNHNGFITAQSTPGKGSTFYIYLPV